jgi:hypothetical protein
MMFRIVFWDVQSFYTAVHPRRQFWTSTIISLNSINRLSFVMVKCVLFEVRTKFLSVVYTSFGFKGLKGLQSFI